MTNEYPGSKIELSIHVRLKVELLSWLKKVTCSLRTQFTRAGWEFFCYMKERGPFMESITEKFSEIEKNAKAIVESSEARKEEMDQAMQRKRDEFDADLEAKTQEKLQKIRQSLQVKMDQLLDEQERKNKKEITSLKEDFEKNHTVYAKEILSHITEVSG